MKTQRRDSTMRSRFCFYVVFDRKIFEINYAFILIFIMLHEQSRFADFCVNNN